MRALFSLVILMLSCVTFAQKSPSTTIDQNYKNWKWKDIHVTKNEYISVVISPKSGGRILEYNLGNNPSLWVNPEMLGKSFKATDYVKPNEWRNFGGYRINALPRNNFALGNNGERTKRWPPPAIWGDSPYDAKMSKDEKGHDVIIVTSQTQKFPLPKWSYKSKEFSPPKIEEELEYERSLYIAPKSSLVYLTHKVTNKGEKTVNRGLLLISQQMSQSSPAVKDGENFRAYIPFDKKNVFENGEPYEISGTPKSRWKFVNKQRFPIDKNNPEDVKRYFNKGTNWLGETTPGVFEVMYDYNLMGGIHIIAAKPWLAYVNKTNNTAFVKILEPYDPKLTYAEHTNASIYNSGVSSGYLETEIHTPLYTVKPGDWFEYEEKHGAAKIESTPVLDVNRTGIITRKLTFKDNKITGAYGVFFEGKAIVKLLDKEGAVLKKLEIKEVNPLKAFVLNDKTDKNTVFSKIELLLIDTEGNEHLLDSLNI